MKKTLYFLILFSLLLLYPQTTYATPNITQIEYLEDGSYFVTTIESQTDLNSIGLRAATSTRSGNKTITYKSSSGSSLWSVTVSGKFSYNGSSATCTSSTVSATSYSSNWKISSKSASKSGSKASATATGKQYKGSTAISSISQSVTLTCSKGGSLS